MWTYFINVKNLCILRLGGTVVWQVTWIYTPGFSASTLNLHSKTWKQEISLASPSLSKQPTQSLTDFKSQISQFASSFHKRYECLFQPTTFFYTDYSNRFLGTTPITCFTLFRLHIVARAAFPKRIVYTTHLRSSLKMFEVHITYELALQGTTPAHDALLSFRFLDSLIPQHWKYHTYHHKPLAVCSYAWNIHLAHSCWITLPSWNPTSKFHTSLRTVLSEAAKLCLEFSFPLLHSSTSPFESFGIGLRLVLFDYLCISLQGD